jgi:deoxyribose-phosphate aldolase
VGASPPNAWRLTPLPINAGPASTVTMVNMFTTDDLLACIDLTDLGDGADIASVVELCARARQYRTAAVCVWPGHVFAARAELAGSAVQVATVLNFPDGRDNPVTVCAQAASAITDGVQELDVVIPYLAMLGGDHESVARLLEPVVSLAHHHGVRVKAILETGALTGRSCIRLAAELAIAAGVDFLKTSTGTTSRGATMPAAFELLLAAEAAPRPVGVKISGGVRTRDDAERFYIAATAVFGLDTVGPDNFRLGASALLENLVGGSAAEQTPSKY